MHSNGRPYPEKLLAEARQERAGGSCERGGSLGTLLELYRNYLHLIARTQIDLHLQALVSPSDVVQEAFLEVVRDFDQFQGVSEREFLGWLRRILIHNLARVVEKQVLARKRNVRRQISLESHIATLEDSCARIEAALVSPLSSPSEQAERRESAAVLANHLSRLPSDYREVIVLRNLESLPFEEVARRMGRTSGAVRILWLRALDELRQLLKEEGRT